jgi:hypothetical protein
MKKHLTFSLALLTIACTTINAQLPSYLPADGLVGWWPFNGNANDESGNGNDGVVNGAVLASDIDNIESQAYYFDGINDYISVGNLTTINGDNSRSFVAWVKLNTGQNGGVIISQGAELFQSGCNQGFHFNATGTAADCGYSGCGVITNCSQVRHPYTLNDGAWHQVVVTYSNGGYGGLKFYADGQIISVDPNNCAQGDQYSSFNTGSLFGVNFGKRNDEFYSNCFLDDIAIYNRALTSQEIQNIYTGTVPAACLQLPANLQQGLVGYWPFCGNANDESGNGNDGAVNGATLAEDRFGNAGSAYSFDGLDDYIIANASTSLDASSYSEITLSAWVNTVEFSPTGSASKIITHTSIDGSNGQQYALSVQHDSALYFLAGTGQFEANGINVSSAVLFTNQWQHAIMTYDGESVRFYINGNLVFTKQESDNFPTSPTGALVFSSIQSSQYNRLYNGLLDDIAIYNRALTPEEVTQLYAVQSTGDPTAGGGGNTTGPLANVPRGISYQAAARDAQGQAIADAPVNVRFSLHEGAVDGAVSYSETHALTTNSIGLFNTVFGNGTPEQSVFDSINWAATTKFLQVEIDLGEGYVDMGTTQLLSVPYAFRSDEAARIKNAGLPIFANNAAALAGGLVAGEMYRTATGDLKIVY